MKPKFPPITDDEILEWLIQGNLKINFKTLEIRKLHKRRGKFKTLGKSIHPISGRVRIVLGDGNRRRTIYRNRLIWMAWHLDKIPPGKVIDHKSEDVSDDSPENLGLHTTEQSSQQGNQKQTQKAYEEIINFFDYITFMKKEPKEPKEPNLQ